MSVARAYDVLAPSYDATLAAQPVTLWMRAVLWQHLDALFPARARVLDLTAGTGSDALHLAARGVRMTALDISAGMIAELRASAARQQLAIDAWVLAAERLNELDARDFDGAFSTFAGLNTLTNLTQLSRDLRAHLKTDARVVLHALNRFCWWEQAAHRALRRPTRAAHVHIGGECVAHQYFDPFALWRAHFAQQFALRRVYGLSLIAAPALIVRAPRLSALLFKTDRMLGRLIPSAGDFFVMELQAR